MKEGEKVVINNKEFEYDEDAEALFSEKTASPQVACPKCKNTKFEISYGNYECIANCNCGHKMSVYTG